MHSVECPLQSNNSKIKESNIDVIPVHHITQSASVSMARLQELRLATQSDPTLCSLAKTVHKGWPQSRKDCPEQQLDFWSFRQEISEEDGLYKNQRLIVTHSKRLETLKVLHLGHYAVDKMQLRAPETILARNQQGHPETIPELQDLYQTLLVSKMRTTAVSPYTRVTMAHGGNRLVRDQEL